MMVMMMMMIIIIIIIWEINMGLSVATVPQRGSITPS
jgi:hypothetical protein